MLVPMSKEQFVQRMLKDARKEKERQRELDRVVKTYLIEKKTKVKSREKRRCYR